MRLFFVTLTLFFVTMSTSAWLFIPSPSATFNPATDLTNEFFFRGDSFTGTTGSVTTIEDLSTNNRDGVLVGGTNWTQNATDSGVNNQGTFSTNGSGYYRYLPDGTNLIGTVNDAFYAYGVVRVPVFPNNFQWWFTAGWISGNFVQTFANSSPSYAIMNAGYSLSPTNPAAMGSLAHTPASSTWVTYIIAYNGGGSATTTTNWTIYYGGSAITVAALSGLGVSMASRNWIGVSPVNSLGTTMRIAEMGLVKGTLTTGTRDSLFAYWTSRYGL